MSWPLVTHETIKCHTKKYSDRVQFWGIDISCSEGARTAEMLFVHSYPAVLIIGLKNNQQNCLYRALTPSASITQLINKIEMGKFVKIS